MKLVIVFLVLATIGFISCRKNCIGVTYYFDIQSKIYPDKDSIRIGDTLWVESSSSTRVTDKVSGSEIDYSGAKNMSIDLSVLSLHPAAGNFAGTVDATQEFTFILKQGSLLSSDQYAVNFLYQESAEAYNFMAGCIPKDTGTYRMYVSDAVNVYSKNHKCDKATFSMSIVNSNQHFEFYQTIGPDVHPDVFALHHYYCFKVY